MPVTCVDFCKALSDETRQKILEMLQQREMCVSNIVESFSISQPTVSHHLNILKNVGLVESRKEGKLVFYSINQENVDECCGMIVTKFSCKEL
ncbi:MAG: metalloregulator ArsR/SmtB family transcription factor [Anaerolineae bacterium]